MCREVSTMKGTFKTGLQILGVYAIVTIGAVGINYAKNTIYETGFRAGMNANPYMLGFEPISSVVNENSSLQQCRFDNSQLRKEIENFLKGPDPFENPVPIRNPVIHKQA